MVQQIEITLKPKRRGFHLVTSEILSQLPKLPKTGIVNIFTKHTSCGLSINENCDPDVRVDMETIFNRLVPENRPEYEHTLEGADDMPAHAKSTLSGVSITIPITDGRLNLGTWQGVYFCEFRNYGGSRELVVTLITGANNPQGIGATTAFTFAREGAKVVLIYKRIYRTFDQSKTDKNGTDRYFEANSGNADYVESRLKEMNADYMILESDISKEAAVKEIYSKVLERYGRVDILVNNAADGDMDGIDTIEKITQEVIDDTFAVNVRGSILMTREMITHRGDYGRIINISTDASQVFAGQIAYGASKATLEALTRSIALEVAKYGITVNCVAPGPTQTGWIDTDLEQSVLPVIPMGKLIQPEDIAETILFLASEQARMLTGQVIKVSGGHAL